MPFFYLQISWTHALRKIVINCYKYHGREDLLPTFADDEDKIEMLEGEEDDEMDEHEPPTSTTIQTVANASTNTTNVSDDITLILLITKNTNYGKNIIDIRVKYYSQIL